MKLCQMRMKMRRRGCHWWPWKLNWRSTSAKVKDWIQRKSSPTVRPVNWGNEVQNKKNQVKHYCLDTVLCICSIQWSWVCDEHRCHVWVVQNALVCRDCWMQQKKANTSWFTISYCLFFYLIIFIYSFEEFWSIRILVIVSRLRSFAAKTHKCSKVELFTSEKQLWSWSHFFCNKCAF